MFSFDKLQRLHRFLDEIDNIKEVIDQNKRALEEMRTYYKDLTDSAAFEKRVDMTSFEGVVRDFFQRIRNFERELGNHEGRVTTLRGQLGNHIELFKSILQFKSTKANEQFARASQESASKMEDVAIKTKHETLSMHIITFFTLVFLPGTFVCTFMASGIIDLNTGDVDTFNYWKVRSGALWLFIAICVPLMAITLSTWSLLYFRTKENTKFTQ